LLDSWEQNSPGRRNVIFKALTNGNPSHLLDPRMFDFTSLQRIAAQPTEKPKNP